MRALRKKQEREAQGKDPNSVSDGEDYDVDGEVKRMLDKHH